MKTLLPQFSVKHPDKRIRQRDLKVKLKGKLYSDKKFGAKQSKSKPGDSVLVKQPKKNKLTPPFYPNPGIITQKWLQFFMVIGRLHGMFHTSNQFI